MYKYIHCYLSLRYLQKKKLILVFRDINISKINEHNYSEKLPIFHHFNKQQSINITLFSELNTNLHIMSIDKKQAEKDLCKALQVHKHILKQKQKSI